MKTESETEPAFKLGAISLDDQCTHFGVWAPKRKSVAVVVDGHPTPYPLTRQPDGVHRGLVPVGVGSHYRYLLDGDLLRPDPRSCFQPHGVHKASEVIASDYTWSDQAWTGVEKRDLVIYEIHIGTFSEEGTFAGAKQKIPWLLELGVTAVEVMPVAQAPGRWNWGYDGVNLFSINCAYGSPKEFKDFIDACHQVGIAVILDVVYNHLGPEGNYLADFGPYFSTKHHTPWGQALNFDGRQAKPVRQFIVDNAISWLDEYHLDGLRLDAVHFMFDDSEIHILRELRQAVDTFAAKTDRHIHLIAEANVFDEDLLSPTTTSSGYDAIWCDCLMHSIYSLGAPDLKLTRRKYHEADIATALQLGFIYAGTDHVRASDPDSNSSVGGHVESLVMALQTHDSVGNHPHGKRLHMLTSKAFQKAAATLFLLYPSIPMIFMGEDVACDAAFRFFADFEDQKLRDAVDQGRAKEYPQHAWDGAILPSDSEAFYRAKIHDSRNHDQDMRNWYRDLLQLRRDGLQDGWLNAENLRVAYAAKDQLYSLTFRCGNAATILVHCRLSATTDPDPLKVTVPDGEVLLYSGGQPTRSEGEHILLGQNEAVIIQRL